jgi:hypothetical protein
VRISELRIFRRKIKRSCIALIYFMVTLIRVGHDGDETLPYKSFLPDIRRELRGILPKYARSKQRRPRGSSPASPRSSNLH